MSNNLDDWLNSLGINEGSTEVTVPASSDTVPAIVESHTESPSSLSEDDLNEILAENGFEPSYVEAEETSEEREEEGGVNTDAYSENGGEGRDLDAEEDADWQEAVDSGRITPVETSPADDHVYFHMPNEEVIAVPVIHEADTQAVEEVEVEVFNEVLQESAPLIPPNSPTLLLNNATSRFSGAEWYSEIQKSRIILAGLGGIGSYCAYNIARMNPAALFMYDDDMVEQANMSGQLYCSDDIGKAKVDAMADMIKSYTTAQNVFAIKDKFTNTSEAGDIMICGFDNMAARKDFYAAWETHVMGKPAEQRSKCLYIDGRLSINILQVFCITGDNDWAMAEYADHYLFSDAEAEATQCSLKQTTYLACMIGSVMVNLFTNWVANTLNPAIPYDLPFFTEYDAQNMIFKTIK